MLGIPVYLATHRGEFVTRMGVLQGEQEFRAVSPCILRVYHERVFLSFISQSGGTASELAVKFSSSFSCSPFCSKQAALSVKIPGRSQTAVSGPQAEQGKNTSIDLRKRKCDCILYFGACRKFSS